MNIVILGVAGFVGSSLAEKLVNNGHNVIGVDDLSFGYAERLASILNKNFRFIESSVENFSKISSLDCDVIVNCAAIAPLPENQIDHMRSITQNVSLCGSVVDLCCRNDIRKIIHFSSSAVYENGQTGRVESCESDELSPRLMYPVSKYLSEEYLKSQYQNFDLDITSIRLFNLYGPKQDYFRKQPPLLGYLIKNILIDKEVTLFASPEARRDYVYIDDLVRFLEMVIDQKSEPRFTPINIGSGNAYTVYDLVKILERVTRKNLKYTLGKTEEFWGKYNTLFDRKIPLSQDIIRDEINKISIANIEKASNIYGWQPKTSIEVGIKNCVEYARRIL